MGGEKGRQGKNKTKQGFWGELVTKGVIVEEWNGQGGCCSNGR